MKPSTIKDRELRAKLQELVARGVNGEVKAAKKKLERLEKRVDFSQFKMATHDIFSGVKVLPSYESNFVCHLSDRDAAQAAAWAIKRETGIDCAFRNDCDLYALATAPTVKQLEPIARRITDGISALWQQYHKAGGLPADRTCFLSGLYDGMTGEQRPLGTPLPLRAIPPVKRAKAKKNSVAVAPGLAAHPYSLALSLGRSIRLDNIAITEIAGELDRKIKGELEDAPSEMNTRGKSVYETIEEQGWKGMKAPFCMKWADCFRKGDRRAFICWTDDRKFYFAQEGFPSVDSFGQRHWKRGEIIAWDGNTPESVKAEYAAARKELPCT